MPLFKKKPKSPKQGINISKPTNFQKQPCPFVSTIEGEITELTWQSGIKTFQNNQTVNGPHWQTGWNNSWAGVYSLSYGHRAVNLKVKITKAENVAGQVKVEGELGGFSVIGVCPAAVGTHVVSATASLVNQTINKYEGSLRWQLQWNNQRFGANQIPIEVYIIYNKPMAFYKRGVWIEALRFLFNRVKITRFQKQAHSVGEITRYCHGSHGFKYDTTRGAPRYGMGAQGGTFNLTEYLVPTIPLVNCYDQAGAVQTLAGALGIQVNWLFQPEPQILMFGYINKTNLIGVGDCNNPFFSGVAPPKPPRPSSPHGKIPPPPKPPRPSSPHGKIPPPLPSVPGNVPVVPYNHPKRTSFGNHAFCEFNAKIHDACAGPHAGTESLKEYLDASVDYAHSDDMFNLGKKFKAGRAVDVKTDCAGVQDVY